MAKTNMMPFTWMEKLQAVLYKIVSFDSRGSMMAAIYFQVFYFKSKIESTNLLFSNVCGQRSKKLFKSMAQISGIYKN